MSIHHSNDPVLTRRTLAKGAAWSVPVVAVASAAPALAASSSCQPSLRWSGGLFYNFGVIDSSTGKTNQFLTLGGQTYVDNLPPGVTVTSIGYTFWLENRQGQQSSGPGAFWMGNGTASTAGYCNSTGCSVNWTPTSGSGFDRTVTNTKNNYSVTYPDGGDVPSWDLNMTWSASRDTVATYTATSSGCRNFDSGPSSRFRVDYTGVTALTSADVRNGKKSIRSFADVTVRLSNGAVLEKTYPVRYTG